MQVFNVKNSKLKTEWEDVDLNAWWRRDDSVKGMLLSEQTADSRTNCWHQNKLLTSKQTKCWHERLMSACTIKKVKKCRLYKPIEFWRDSEFGIESAVWIWRLYWGMPFDLVIREGSVGSVYITGEAPGETGSLDRNKWKHETRMTTKLGSKHL